MTENLSTLPTPAPFHLDWPPVLEALQKLIPGDMPVYLVGGAVRDALLRRPIRDLDFVMGHDGRRWARKVANAFDGAYYPLDPERSVGRAIIEHEGERYIIDVSQYRNGALAADLAGRDFTVNAIAVSLADPQQLIDPLGGLADLQQKRLRQCMPAALEDDPVRLLRAVRQSVALKLLIEPETRKAIKRLAPQLANVSMERVRDEFMTTLGGPRPHVALRTLDMLGLLAHIMPEVDPMRGVPQSEPHVYDVWEHTLNVVERLDGVIETISPYRTGDTAADPALGMVVYMLDRFRHPLQAHLNAALPNGRNVKALLILAALLHDCGKPATHSTDPAGRHHFYRHEVIGAPVALERGIALRLSNGETKRLEAAILHHMRPMQLHMQFQDTPPEQIQVSRRAIFRFWRKTGESGIDVCLLTLADHLGMVGIHFELRDWIRHVQIVGALLDGYFNRKDEIISPPPLVGGHDLMQALALEPGPEVGRLLALLGEAQVVGEIATAEEALALAAKLHAAPPDTAHDED